MTNYGMRLFPQHAEMLAASGIPPEHARARDYVSVDTKKRLEDLRIAQVGRQVPGLLIPLLRADGSVWGYQYRPDSPRERNGKTRKYETPVNQYNHLDVPPGVGDKLGDPRVPLWVTEGSKKADSAVVAGLACIALPGVWNWRGKNDSGGKAAIPDWHDVALNDRRIVLAFDSDVMVKKPVRRALAELAGYLASKGAKVEYAHLPHDDDTKTGLDDYLADGHDVDDLYKLVRPDLPPVVEPPADPAPAETRATKPQPVEPITLDEARKVFRRWLGDDYDTDALDAMLATVAVERLDGDPLWLLLISGSGNAKTETVQALDGIDATVISTISSPGALLSASPRADRTKYSTGGLLRKIGNRGVMVVKDVTSILSMDRNARGEMLAALREVHDGRWSRNVGTDGGQTIEWRGRLVVVGAVTTAWDRAHDVISSMGDRFVLLRMDSGSGRVAAGRHAICNTGAETELRAELAGAVAGVLAGMNTEPTTLTDAEVERLLAAADVVTRSRTGVDYDYRGDVIDAHAPEMPTRFAKQLAQVVRGAVAIGMDRHDALHLAIRCARDSMPPLRLAILDDVAANPATATREVRKRLGKPRATVDRQLQALNMLDVLDVDEYDETWAGKPTTIWRYTVAEHIDPTALDPQALPDLLPPTPQPQEKGDEQGSNETRFKYPPTFLAKAASTANPAANAAANDSHRLWSGSATPPTQRVSRPRHDQGPARHRRARAVDRRPAAPLRPMPVMRATPVHPRTPRVLSGRRGGGFVTAPTTPHLPLGLARDAERLDRVFRHAVCNLLDAGIRLPCVEQPQLFHSDRAAERREAARMCVDWSCMALRLCAAYADTANERIGVWRGKDRKARARAVA